MGGKIIQKVTISKQVLAEINRLSEGSEGGNISISIINTGSIYPGEENHIRGTFILSDFIDSFRDPAFLDAVLDQLAADKEISDAFLAKIADRIPGRKLRGMSDRICAIAISIFPSQVQATDWLGGTRRLINYRKGRDWKESIKEKVKNEMKRLTDGEANQIFRR